VDGGERGHTVKVCAEPSCSVHFADRASQTPTPEQLAKEREQRRKELEKRKLETTVRHRTLAEVLRKVGAPLDRTDLVLIANALLEKTEPMRRQDLARRHKVAERANRSPAAAWSWSMLTRATLLRPQQTRTRLRLRTTRPLPRRLPLLRLRLDRARPAYKTTQQKLITGSK
jgi:hypothetical protein